MVADYWEYMISYLRKPEVAVPNILILILFKISLFALPSFLIVSYMYRMNIYSFGLLSSSIFPLHIVFSGIFMIFIGSLCLFISVPYFAFKYKQNEGKSKLENFKYALKESSVFIVANLFVVTLIAYMVGKGANYEKILLLSLVLLVVAVILVSFLFCEPKKYLQLVIAMIALLYIIGFQAPEVLLDGVLTGFKLRAERVKVLSLKHEHIDEVEGRLILLSPTEIFIKIEGKQGVQILSRAVHDSLQYLK